mgnify:CR=1 FL=1
MVIAAAESTGVKRRITLAYRLSVAEWDEPLTAHFTARAGPA